MDYTVASVMQREVETVHPAMNVGELCAKLTQCRVEGFPVVEQNKLVGVVSRTDVLQALQSSNPLVDGSTSDDDSDCTFNVKSSDSCSGLANKLTVRDIMSVNVIVARRADSLHDVADLMYRKHVHRIFVVDNDELLGVVTPFDFVRLYAQDQIGADGRPIRTPDF